MQLRFSGQPWRLTKATLTSCDSDVGEFVKVVDERSNTIHVYMNCV